MEEIRKAECVQGRSSRKTKIKGDGKGKRMIVMGTGSEGRDRSGKNSKQMRKAEGGKRSRK